MGQEEAPQGTLCSPFPLPVPTGAPPSPCPHLQGLPKPHPSAPSALSHFPILWPQCSQHTQGFPIPLPPPLSRPAVKGGLGEDSL